MHTIGDEPTSYCVYVQCDGYQFISSVFTFPKFRRKGYGKRLLREVVRGVRQPTYLICTEELEPFYAKIGFTTSTRLPWYIKWRLKVVSTLSGWFLAKPCVAMEKAPAKLNVQSR